MIGNGPRAVGRGCRQLRADLDDGAATIGTITAASLTAGLTGTASKVYDTNTTATLAAGNYTLSTILGSDVVSVSGTSASYDTKNVGTGKTVTATGLVLSGADGGNYVLTSTTAIDTIGTITAASLTAGLTGTVSKVYDTNTTAPLAAGNYTLGTILGSDVVSVSGTGAYDTKNVGHRQDRHGERPRAVGRGCRQLRADLDDGVGGGSARSPRRA